MASVFLSHTRADKDIARVVCSTLAKHGVEVWFDEAEIAPGDTLLSVIENAIERIDVLAVVLTPASVSAPWVVRELQHARWTQRLGGRVRVVPLLLQDCDLPPFLRHERYLDLRVDQEAALQTLADFLLGRSAELPVTLQMKLADLVTRAGPGRWSRWSRGRLGRAELSELVRRMTRDDLEVAVELAHGLGSVHSSRSQTEVLRIATAALGGAQGRARRSVRRLLDEEVLESSPHHDEVDAYYQAGVLAAALLDAAKRSGGIPRLPPPEPERLSELLSWQHLGQRRAWSLSGPEWSALSFGNPRARPPQRIPFTGGRGIIISGTREIARPPVDTLVWSTRDDLTWVFADPEDRDPEVVAGYANWQALGFDVPWFSPASHTHYPEIDLATFDDLAIAEAHRPS